MHVCEHVRACIRQLHRQAHACMYVCMSMNKIYANEIHVYVFMFVHEYGIFSSHSCNDMHVCAYLFVCE